MAPIKNLQLCMMKVPVEAPVPGEHLKLIENQIDLDTYVLNGGVLVQNLALSLDPAQRGRMRDASIASYAAAYVIGQPIEGYQLGRIVRSDYSSKFPVGAILYGFSTFENYSFVSKAQLDGYRFYVIPDTYGLPLTTWVGALGMSGTTGYWGFKRLANAKAGETIYVSAASGAVGMIVAQLAKRQGLKVIGSAGSDAKVEWLKSLGCFDVTFNYKTQSTLEILKANPFDIFLDSVGGEVLDIVLATINQFGRIIAVGSVSQYNLKPEDRYALKNYAYITGKEIEMKGFIISSYPGKDLTDFFEEMPPLVASGEIKIREHITYGFDNGEAICDMLSGKAEGKAVISLE